MATTKVNSEFIAVNAISGTIIADGAITSTHLAANCVDSSELVTGSIDTIHIAANQVTATKIVTNAIQTRHIADDQVTGDKLTNNITIAGTLTSTGAFTSPGIDDNADAIAITIDSSENVGIGTTSPDRKLDVSGTGNVYGKFQSTNATGAGIEVKDTGEDWLIQADDGTGSGGLAFYDLGRTAYRMFLDASGNLGIGTTSPSQKLDVNGTVELNNLTVGGAQGSDGQVLTSTGSGVAWETPSSFNADAAQTFNDSGAAVDFRIEGDTDQNLFFVDGSADAVGIGTNDPNNGYGGAITAAKVAILSGAAGNNGGSSTLLIGGDDKHYAYMQGTHTSSGNTQLDFGTANGANNPTQRATLNEHGAWKVKSTSGAYFNIISKYHEINSNDGALTTVLIRNGSTYYANCVNFWLYGGAPNNTQSQFWTCNDTVGQKASLQSNGGFYNYQSNNSNLCDEREKKNIEVLPSTWNSVKSWKLKKFHYNEDENSDDKRLGVIAQEIETTNPELITAHTRVQAKDAVLWTKEDDLPEGVSIGDTKTAAQDAVVRKGVKEQQMYIMAIKALQEAMTEIESLKARIETLEG